MTNPLASAPKEAPTLTLESEAGQLAAASGFSAHPPPSDVEDPLVGAVLNGTYVVERCIGEGGMGRVYEARHTRIQNKRFAIKVLLPEFARHPEVMVRFQREAEATASIAHPNVIGVYDVDRTPQGLAYMVCDLLEGVDLAEHLERVGRLSWPAAVRIGAQVCDALAAAHARGVIHRDLKPQNVFLLGDRSAGASAILDIRVLDFGLSRFADGTDDQLTKTGFIMGTPSYMSPEQAHGQRGDHRIDIYGVGAILYSALTGKAPFEGSTPQQTVLSVMGREPERLRSLEPSIPESLELVVQRAMAKKPDDRYQDCVSLGRALAALDTPPTPVSPTRMPLESAISLDVQADQVRSARPRLVGLLLMIVFALVSLFAVAVAGIELLAGLKFSATEFTLLMLVAFGTALTPGILVITNLRRAWENSARVLDYIDRLYPPLVAGIAAYGSASLLVRLADVVLSRYGWSPLGPVAGGSGFLGWDLLFSVIALLAAGTTALHTRLQSTRNTRIQRLLLRPIIAFATTLLAGLALLLGGAWRAGADLSSVGPQSATAASPSLDGNSNKVGVTAPKDEALGPNQPNQPSPLSKPFQTQPAASGRPTDAELAQAIAQGVEGLLPLAERYPKEPLVLEPLFAAFASRATSRRDAMVIAQRLLEIVPEKARDQNFGIILKSAAATPGEASDQAFNLLAKKMGSTGVDLLFDLATTNPKLKERADKLLQDPSVRAQATPALSIALDLRDAATCEARLPLLTRATGLGDERSVQLLTSLATGTKRGCGKWKAHPCNPPCVKEAEKFRAVVVKITQRLAPH
ncbi:MAG: serine/threonine-protein kinase [Polyangiaceae bacterium]|nr:serine/threonine-protein kinase [Polyangiaceae bacterium]